MSPGASGRAAMAVAHYERVFAGGPRARVPIRRGRELAVALGYPEALVSRVPEPLWDFFHPCGNPLFGLALPGGAPVLNLGCGAGFDSCALALETGGAAKVINADPAPSALLRAGELARALSLLPAPAVRCVAAGLPFAAGAFRCVLANGVLNLFPEKPPGLAEIFRVLAPGGVLAASDLCALSPLSPEIAGSPEAFAWCMTGAESVGGLTRLLVGSGFQGVSVSVAEDLGLFARVEVRAKKPETV